MPLKNSLLFPAIQSIHLAGIALLVGSIVIIDLHVLGCVLRDRRIADVTRLLRSWRLLGLAIMLTTGPVLFASDIPRYSSNPAFRFKMAALGLALLTHFITFNRPLTKPRGRISALVSIALWTCVVLGGRAIADFDI